MPELTYEHLPDILKKNKEVYNEVDHYIKIYLRDFHIKGWTIAEGAKRWISEKHFLIEVPIEDQSLGGFIFLKPSKVICYINTWQPRIYQNFVLLHELFHIISQTHDENTSLHLIESDLDRTLDERKADYFASLLLLDANEVISFYNTLEGEKLLDKVFFLMERFKTPYKAILIRLFELELIEPLDLKQLFDMKIDFEDKFLKLGIDSSSVEKSYKNNLDKIEKWMETRKESLPDIANENNFETLKKVKEYFDLKKLKRLGN